MAKSTSFSSAFRPGMTRSAKGFSLVEIMVALVIGMIAVLVVMQVARLAEGQKRTTTGAGNAQSNAALAMYTIQRDIKQAGYGMTSRGVFGCPLTLRKDITLTALAPVTINSADVVAGDANTDTLLVVYGGSAGTPEGDTIVSTGAVGTKDVDQRIGITSPANFRVGEYVFAAPKAPTNGCALTMNAITEVAATSITVPGIGATEGMSLFGFGPRPRIVAYAIRSGNLTMCDYMQADCSAECTAGNTTCNASWAIIAQGIVSLRAQYGRDATAPIDGSVDTWDQTTPANTSSNQEAYAGAWAAISAVRLALVTRNSQPDRVVVTSDQPIWTGSTGTGSAPIKLVPDGDTSEDWKHFRYQVYEAIVPLRNLPWMGSGA